MMLVSFSGRYHSIPSRPLEQETCPHRNDNGQHVTELLTDILQNSVRIVISKIREWFFAPYLIPQKSKKKLHSEWAKLRKNVNEKMGTYFVNR